HSEAINLEFERPISVDQAREALRNAPGIVLVDDYAGGQVPLPLSATGRDEVFVGRIRRDPTITNGLNLWVVADNLRKGAATNAVQIDQVLVERNLLPARNYARLFPLRNLELTLSYDRTAFRGGQPQPHART